MHDESSRGLQLLSPRGKGASLLGKREHAVFGASFVQIQVCFIDFWKVVYRMNRIKSKIETVGESN